MVHLKGGTRIIYKSPIQQIQINLAIEFMLTWVKMGAKRSDPQKLSSANSTPDQNLERYREIAYQQNQLCLFA